MSHALASGGRRRSPRPAVTRIETTTRIRKSMGSRPLIAGVDYYPDEQGRWVFTEKYHRDRGYCCQSGCRHCPYGFRRVAPPQPGPSLEPPSDDAA